MSWTTYVQRLGTGLALTVCLAPVGARGVAGQRVPVQEAPRVRTAEVLVVVTGLESDDGTVRLALFDGPDGFTDEPTVAEVVTPAGRTAEWRLRVPFGRYAVAAIHDADGDGELDTNFLGMPRERYGFSNGARGTFGPPSFEDASFPVGRGAVTVAIEVR